jgi:hypothetical protein
MINTASPTAVPEETQITDESATKKSPATKLSASKKSPTDKKKAAVKKVDSKSAKSKKKNTAASKAAEKAKPAKETKQAKQPRQTKQKVTKPKTSKADKPKKPKLVRDSFTMPAQEYALLAQVKKTCHADGIPIKKSELLRIGVAQLATMSTKKLKAAQAALTPLRAGRPKKHK